MNQIQSVLRYIINVIQYKDEISVHIPTKEQAHQFSIKLSFHSTQLCNSTQDRETSNIHHIKKVFTNSHLLGQPL